MNGPALFEETQRFSPWLYVILCVAAAILLGVLTMRQTTTVSPETVDGALRFLYTARIPVAEVARRRRCSTGRCAITAAGESGAPGAVARSTHGATRGSC